MQNHDPHRYDDMLNMSHPVSKKRPQMSLYNRAAQFSPFAALTGYEEEIDETGRLTSKRRELDEHAKEALDHKFSVLLEQLSQHLSYTFLYFSPDESKDGGSYEEITGIVKKINPANRTLTLYANNHIQDGQTIPIDDIFDIKECNK